MKIIHSIQDISPELQGSVVTIGNFDGVHLGHQSIFKQVIRDARKIDRPAVVITFDPHPKMVLHPERRPFYLVTTIEEKAARMAETGIDALIIIPFSLEFAGTTAGQFVTDILWDKLRISKIIIGHDYSFGRNKEGNEAFLAAQGEKLGFAVELIQAFRHGDTIISSTRVRNALLDGRVRLASEWLGRPYNLAGKVIRGHQRGAGLGFPTANIKPEKLLLPADGVYAVIVRMNGNRYRGVLNIGNNPTFGDMARSVEVFILDFKGDVYDKDIEVFFIEEIRREIKFDGPEKLIAQIRQDIDKAGDILKGMS
jgi:riboflavin kinase / FMN adenylyltransferase